MSIIFPIESVNERCWFGPLEKIGHGVVVQSNSFEDKYQIEGEDLTDFLLILSTLNLSRIVFRTFFFISTS